MMLSSCFYRCRSSETDIQEAQTKEAFRDKIKV